MEQGASALRVEIPQEEEAVEQVVAEAQQATQTSALFQPSASAEPVAGSQVVAKRKKRARRDPWVYVVDIPREIQEVATRTRSGRL